MGNSYQKGIAFIFEGPTEKVFYTVFLERACSKHPGYSLEKSIDPKSGEVFYALKKGESQLLIKMNTVGAISQITHSGAWFSTSCHQKHKDLDWTAVLCYDTDEYQSSFSKFQEGDWDVLRQNLYKSKANLILDLASSADIEDTMLLDSDNVFRFLQLPPGPVPSGGKGKSKMKKIYRMKGRGSAYHSGDKARSLIEALDFDVITAKSPMPFRDLEAICFCLE